MNPDFIRPSKEAIALMPLFKGLASDKIIMVADATTLSVAAEILADVTELGFDTESKPTFIKGEKSSGPHVIQLATGQYAFVFTPHFLPGIALAISVLAAENITKYGFGLSGDKKLFKRKFNADIKNTVDLAVVAKKAFALKEAVGARAAVAILFKTRLAKSAQTSNWANYPLQQHQLKYAADDAYVGFCVARELKNLGLMV
ncbi:MAG: 3'-5' exonuclease [Marinagarivorans sp.]|nr:3'-5' exonuclease [Marinagarivorans sp.]